MLAARLSQKDALHFACAEARKWLGATSPNPPVGAVALDTNGNLIAVAAHHKAGEAHAEAALLNHCDVHNLTNRIHTMCVTLEPCNHQGRTPPCSEAIIAAGIKHVVIGARDPNPAASGGMERLRAAGIDVSLVDHPESLWLSHPFTHSVKSGLPLVTVKRAFDRNGSMIPPTGQKTFTSSASLKFAHLLRKKSDAIITGSGTILADAPAFTVRHVADYPGKRRFLAILDRRGRVSQSYIEAAKTRGLDVLIHRDLDECLHDLAAHKVRDVLVEAGPALSNSVLNHTSWSMDVTIRQGLSESNADQIDVRFAPGLSLPAPVATFQWDYVLPGEFTENHNDD